MFTATPQMFAAIATGTWIVLSATYRFTRPDCLPPPPPPPLPARVAVAPATASQSTGPVAVFCASRFTATPQTFAATPIGILRSTRAHKLRLDALRGANAEVWVVTTLEWDGCLNVRDLGGLPTAGGGRTREGSVVRADNIRRLTDAGWHALEHHGVTRIVDLRWPEELQDDQPRDADLEVVHVSVLGESWSEDPGYVARLDAHLDKVADVVDHYAWSYLDFL